MLRGIGVHEDSASIGRHRQDTAHSGKRSAPGDIQPLEAPGQHGAPSDYSG